MTQQPKPSVERINQAIALGGAIAAVLTGVLGLVREVRVVAVPMLEFVDDLPLVVRWIFIALLFAVAVRLFIWLRNKPRKATQVTAPPPFEGRERDLKNLRDACINHRLVFVVGDSGVGKSALIENFVKGENNRFRSIVIRHWGEEWVQGPIDIMTFALEDFRRAERAALAPAGPAAPAAPAAPVNAVAPPAPGNPDPPVNQPWFEQLRSIASLHGRVLIIFDGFDDYSVQFRRFLFDDEKSRFLHPSELRERNAFWNEISKLLDEKVIRCIFVTRSDAQSALAPVRFVDPEVLHIFRLARETAEKLLDQILSADAGEPDWEPLRDQLLDDLDDRGVLPAQMLSASRALQLLPRRTLREYRARGGLVGLELERFELLVAQAAHAARMTFARAGQLLREMVDESETPPKARPLPLSGRPDREEHKLMEQLERHQVVRPIAEQPDTWTLYHDYVARVVVAMNRRADQWTAQLSDARKAAGSARGLWAKYWALLSPPAQIVLAARRLFFPRQGFRYRENRRFAVASLVRFVPYIGLSGFLLYWQIESQAAESGRQLFAQLSSRSSTPDPAEVEVLWHLRNAGHARAREAISSSLVTALDEVILVAPIEKSHRPRVEAALAAIRPEIAPENRPVPDDSARAEPQQTPLDELRSAVTRAQAQLKQIPRARFASELERNLQALERLRDLIRSKQPQQFLDLFWNLTHQNPLHGMFAVGILAGDDEHAEARSLLSRLFEGYSRNDADPKQTWYEACRMGFVALIKEGEEGGSVLRKPSVEVESIVTDIVNGRRELAGDTFQIRVELGDARGTVKKETVRRFIFFVLSFIDRKPELLPHVVEATAEVLVRAADVADALKQLIDATRDVKRIEWTSLLASVLVSVLEHPAREGKNTTGMGDLLKEMDDLVIRLIDLMQDRTWTRALSDSVEKLCRTKGIDHAPVFRQLTTRLLSTADVERFRELLRCLPSLQGVSQADVAGPIVQLLALPTCVGTCRLGLIQFLNKAVPSSGRTFWALEEVARKERLPKGPPRTQVTSNSVTAGLHH